MKKALFILLGATGLVCVAFYQTQAFRQNDLTAPMPQEACDDPGHAHPVGEDTEHAEHEAHAHESGDADHHDHAAHDEHAHPEGDAQHQDHADDKKDHAHEHDACDGHSHEHADHDDLHAHDDHTADHKSETQTAPDSSQILQVSEQIRKNLNIQFAQAEQRQVSTTLRLPGRFAQLPSGMRDYIAPCRGRVLIHTTLYENVAPGALLFSIESPEWHDIQHELRTARNEIAITRNQLSVAQASLEQAQKNVAFIAQRLEKLAEVGLRKIELEGSVVEWRNTAKLREAEVHAAKTTIELAQRHFEGILLKASRFCGESYEEITQETRPGHQRWEEIERLEIRAGSAGKITEIAVLDQGWAESGMMVLHATAAKALYFEAQAPQSNLGLLKDGLDARISPPQGGAVDFQDSIVGKMRLGTAVDQQQGTVPVLFFPERLPDWALAGASASLEVFPGGLSGNKIALPMRCIVRDGLRSIFFLRDRNKADQIYVVEADLGANDGRWVEVRHGLEAGDEVVLEGAQQLKLSLSGNRKKAPVAGHFHGDGVFHEEEH